MAKEVRLRTTLVVDYTVSESVADIRCNQLTPMETAEWAVWYVERAHGRLISAKTERLDKEEYAQGREVDG